MDLPQSQQQLIPYLPEEIGRECLLRVSLKHHSVLQAVCRSWKALVKSPEFSEERRLHGYAHSCVCLIQSLCDSLRGKHLPCGVTVYDCTLKTWERLPVIPEFENGLPLFCQCVSVENCLVLLGGWNPVTWDAMKCVYIFDFFTEKWRSGADMLGVRSFFACGVMDKFVVVAGGHDDNKNALKTAEIYNLQLDEWQPLPNMSQERDECKGAVVDGKWYVISGYATDSQGQFVRSADVLDLHSNSNWRVVEDMWPVATCPALIVSLNSQLFSIQRHELLRYNFKENSWNAIDSIPDSITIATCSAALQGSIFVTGYSRTDQNQGNSSVFIYTLAKGTDGKGNWAIIKSEDKFDGVAAQVACPIQI
eukprot:c15586_g1_i1 orf=156-1247(+)